MGSHNYRCWRLPAHHLFIYRWSRYGDDLLYFKNLWPKSAEKSLIQLHSIGFRQFRWVAASRSMRRAVATDKPALAAAVVWGWSVRNLM